MNTMEQNPNSDQKRNQRRFSFRKKLYVFLICFFISSLFWILIKLSREYTEVQQYTVVYTNIPHGKVVVNSPDSLFTLNLKSKGFKIFLNMIFLKPHSISVDIASLIKKRNNSNEDYYIATANLCNVIGKQIHYPNNVISVTPDTVYFRLEKVFSKKLPVKIKLNLTCAQQYEFADSMRIEPDSVLASGPFSVIDTIKFVETTPQTLSNLSSNQALSLEFMNKYNDCNLTIFPTAAKVFIPVEKFTEATIELPIDIENNTNNYNVRTFPEKVKVTYIVSFNNFKKVKPDMFTVVADISESYSAKSKKLKVDVVKFPSYVKIRKIDPEKIEYIILK
jgi:hypothetical protein